MNYCINCFNCDGVKNTAMIIAQSINFESERMLYSVIENLCVIDSKLLQAKLYCFINFSILFSV